MVCRKIFSTACFEEKATFTVSSELLYKNNNNNVFKL